MAALKSVAIVGAGVSGLYLAVCLSKKGYAVRLFEPKTSWEKPCGSGMSLERLREIPLCEDFPSAVKIGSVRLFSPNGRECLLDFPAPLEIALREDLSDFLFKKAKGAGVFFAAPRVEGLERGKRGWIVRTEKEAVPADFVVGADGAAGFVRQALGLTAQGDRMTIEVSYRIPRNLVETPVVRFLEETPGFFWAFSGGEGSTLGLWGTAKLLHARNLFEKLDRMSENLLQVPIPREAIRQIARLHPFAKFEPRRIAGNDWAVVGEAAGLSDPFTLEGAVASLQSAALLAAAFDAAGGFGERYLAGLQDQVVRPLQKRLRPERILHRRPFLDWAIGRAAKKSRQKERFLKTSFLRS